MSEELATVKQERDHWKQRAEFFAQAEAQPVECGIRNGADWLSEKQAMEHDLAEARKRSDTTHGWYEHQLARAEKAEAALKAEQEKWVRAYRFMRVAQDDDCRWPESWRECGSGPDCNCRVIRDLAKATRAILAPTEGAP